MKSLGMKWVVPSVVLAIAALVVFQVVWLVREAKMQEQEDRKRITEAIHLASEDLEKQEAIGFIGNALDSVFVRHEFPGLDSNTIEIPQGFEREIIMINDTDMHRAHVPAPPLPPAPPIPPGGHADHNLPLPHPPIIVHGDSQQVMVMRTERMKSAVQDVMMHYVFSGGMPGKNLRPEIVDSALKSNFEKKGIDYPFRAQLLHGRRDRIIFADTSKAFRGEDSAWTFRTPLFRGEPAPFHTELIVTVDPGKQSVVQRILPQIIFAALLTIGMLILFVSIYREALKQKKIGEIRRDFINNMTHEFKTPLATMSLAADTIMNDKVIGDTEKVRYYAEQIKHENRKLNQQVEKVLELSLTEKNGVTISKEEVNLVDLIHNAVQSMKLQVESKGGVINVEGDLSELKIMADPFHFERVLLNLVDNAMKYGGIPPVIRIEIVRSRGGVEVKISDNGNGIPREEWQTIFDPFHRVSTGDVHNVKGFGLGLSYAKSVITEHGGSIRVTKSNIAGTTFTITLMHN